jgi:hypothetical protein
MAELGEKKLILQSVDNRGLTWIDIQKPTREKLMKLFPIPFSRT